MQRSLLDKYLIFPLNKEIQQANIKIDLEIKPHSRQKIQENQE